MLLLSLSLSVRIELHTLIWIGQDISSMLTLTYALSSCRDLKAENVLLHQQGHWVLCDFGSTTSFAGVYESTNAIMAAEEIIRKYTTPAYRAPEVPPGSLSNWHKHSLAALLLLSAKVTAY